MSCRFRSMLCPKLVPPPTTISWQAQSLSRLKAERSIHLKVEEVVIMNIWIQLANRLCELEKVVLD